MYSKFKPKSITELAVLTAALRPTGESYRDDVMARKFHRNPLPQLDDLFKDGYGYMVFQEDITNFLTEICGFNPSEADKVRRDIGHKNKEAIDRALPRILDGYVSHSKKPRNRAKEEASEFMQVIESSARYGFNRSHSIAYSINTFICGWLRCYHPYEFITAYLNNVVTQDDIAKATELARAYGITVTSPKYGLATDIYSFDRDNHTITKGLASVKYMNPKVSTDLYDLAHKCGTDKSFVDVLTDIVDNHIKINSRQLDILIKIGYFEQFGHPRQLLAELDVYNQLIGGKIRSMKVNNIPACLHNIDISRYCNNIKKNGDVGKTWIVTNGTGLLEEALRCLPTQPETTLQDRLTWSREFLGYSDVATHKPEDRRKVLITKVTPLISKVSHELWSYRLEVSGIQTGHNAVIYVRSSVCQLRGKLKANDIIECGRLLKDKKGYWQLATFTKLTNAQ